MRFLLESDPRPLYYDTFSTIKKNCVNFLKFYQNVIY